MVLLQPLWCPLCPVSEAVDGSSPPFPCIPSRLKAINRDGAAKPLHPTSTGKHFALKLPCQHSMIRPSYLVSFLSNVSSKWSPVISKSMTRFTESGRTGTTSSLRVLLAANGGTWASFQDWPSAPSLLLRPASWYQWCLHWYCPSPSVLMQQMLCSRVPCFEQSRQWLMDWEAHYFTDLMRNMIQCRTASSAPYFLPDLTWIPAVSTLWSIDSQYSNTRLALITLKTSSILNSLLLSGWPPELHLY